MYLMASFLIAFSWEELSLAAFQLRSVFPLTSVFTHCILSLLLYLNLDT